MRANSLSIVHHVFHVDCRLTEDIWKFKTGSYLYGVKAEGRFPIISLWETENITNISAIIIFYFTFENPS